MDSSQDILARITAQSPDRIDLKIDRMHEILERLGNPHLALPPVVHVAGTNGKGSTAAYIRAMLEAAGYGVHVYTSPHLVRFHERFRLAETADDGSVASRDVTEPELAAALLECEAVKGDIAITYFEAATVAAFILFARFPADAVILEVGLGGRLDATNVIDQPAATIITPISLDHAEYLGNSLERIAAEKAGILKRNVPCVVAEQTREVERVIDRAAARLSVPLSISGQDWHVGEERGRLVFEDERGLMDLPLPRLPGRHQFENAGAAIATLRHLPFIVGEDAVTAGLQTVDWPARMQPIVGGPISDAAPPGTEIWLDGGHNPAAGEALAAALAELEERRPRPLILIAGMLEDKDWGGFFTPFEGLARSVIAVPIPEEGYGVEPETLARHARQAGLAAETAADIGEALASLPRSEPLRVLICGSLYLAGHVLKVQESVRQ